MGLSATLGDKSLAAEYLRPGAGNKVQTIDAAAEGYELKLIVKGYSDEWAVSQKPEPTANGVPSHNTFSRLFRNLDPDQFRDSFQRL